MTQEHVPQQSVEELFQYALDHPSSVTAVLNIFLKIEVENTKGSSNPLEYKEILFHPHVVNFVSNWPKNEIMATVYTPLTNDSDFPHELKLWLIKGNKQWSKK